MDCLHYEVHYQPHYVASLYDTSLCGIIMCISLRNTSLCGIIMRTSLRRRLITRPHYVRLITSTPHYEASLCAPLCRARYAERVMHRIMDARYASRYVVAS